MPTNTRMVLKAGHLIDGTGGPPREQVAIVSNGRAVAEIVPLSEVHVGSEDVVVEATSAWVLPGLIDAHVHVCADSNADAIEDTYITSTAALTARAVVNARRALAAGYTSLRDLGGRDQIDVALRDAVESEVVDGPRLRVTGEGISMHGGDSAPRHRPEVSIRFRNNVANTADEARAAARYQLSMGVDILKFVASSMAYASPDQGARFWPELDADMIRGVIHQAQTVDRITAAHCHGGSGATASIDAGVTTIEHGHWLDRAQLDRMAERGTILVPILSPHHPGRLLDDKLRTVELALRAGVRIAPGSNAGASGVAHGANARELELLVMAGVHPRQAVHSATQVAAQAMGLGNQIGTIEVGKWFDAIVLNADPLADIKHLQPEHVRVVVQNGRKLLDRGEISTAEEEMRMKVPLGLSNGVDWRRG